MTVPEAMAHDKLLQAFGDRPFRRAEALVMVSEGLLQALVAAGMIDLLEGRLKYAREFLELEQLLCEEAETDRKEDGQRASGRFRITPGLPTCERKRACSLAPQAD